MKIVVYTEDEPPRFLGFADLNVERWGDPPPWYERDGRIFQLAGQVATTPLYRRQPQA